MPWVLDLDGVVRLGEEPVPGAAEAVAALRAAGETVVFATNNSSARVVDQESALEAMGVPAAGSLLSSSQAGASLVEAGERVLVVGGPGLREEVERRGAVLVADGPCDAVVSGLDRDFSYATLRAAGRAVRDGARWILTNHDPTFPTPTGLDPGAGSMAAAIAAAAGREPDIVAGKPHEPMARLVRERLGGDGVVVGDRVDTDGAFATQLGYRFALVFTGVAGPEDVDAADPPWRTAPDLRALVDAVVA